MSEQDALWGLACIAAWCVFWVGYLMGKHDQRVEDQCRREGE